MILVSWYVYVSFSVPLATTIPSETGVRVCWPIFHSKSLAPIVSEPTIDPSDSATAVNVVEASVRTTLPPVTILGLELTVVAAGIKPPLYTKPLVAKLAYPPFNCRA